MTIDASLSRGNEGRREIQFALPADIARALWSDIQAAIVSVRVVNPLIAAV